MYYYRWPSLSSLHSSSNVARHSRTGLLLSKDLGRRQYRHHSTSIPHFVRLSIESSLVQFAKTLLCGHLFAIFWLRYYLLLVQRPGRQPFSKRHAQARIVGASLPSPSMSFLLLLSALDSVTSSARGFMQAITRSCHYYYCYCIAALQVILFTLTLYLLHNLLLRIMERNILPH